VRVIFNCHTPFALAPRGVQEPIEQTRSGLQQLGVSVEALRWWDDQQTGDVLHHFGRMPMPLLRLAQAKGLKVVTSVILPGEAGGRGRLGWFEKVGLRVFRTFAPAILRDVYGVDSYRLSDACIVGSESQASLLTSDYAVRPASVSVIPPGADESFATAGERRLRQPGSANAQAWIDVARQVKVVYESLVGRP
jgi:hypothetical protein